MRLLDAQTKQLADDDFFDSTTAYVILSHRWQALELTIHDLKQPNHVHSPGFKKISGACDLAQRNGHRYIWIDTCCIDKTSSAELSEAINSMFKYEWFTRGWTLQELLAPEVIEFYDKDWVFIGTRTSLQDEISSASSIPVEYLSGERHIWSASIAQRMSWAASRRTTRIEDQAYSLLGVFNINLPLLYGEEKKAFMRLQHEILRQSSDQSLFAWGKGGLHELKQDDWGDLQLPDSVDSYRYGEGLLAPSLEYFAKPPARYLAAAFGPKSTIVLEQSNSSMRMFVPTLPTKNANIRFVLLDCRVVDDCSNMVLGFIMVRDHASPQWHRADPFYENTSHGGGHASIWLTSWTTAKLAGYETINSVSSVPQYCSLLLPAPSTPECWGYVLLEVAPELPERLAACQPASPHRQHDGVLVPRVDRSGRWNEVRLLFRPRDVGRGGEAFDVILKPQVFSEAFWSIGGRRAPFTCHLSSDASGIHKLREDWHLGVTKHFS